MKRKNEHYQIALEQWCKLNKLNLFQALSLCLTGSRSFNNLVRGEEVGLSARHNIFLLTNLPEFELSLEEKKKYESSANSNKEIEIKKKKLAIFLINRWKETKRPLKENESLIINTSKKKTKNLHDLVDVLWDKYFPQEKIPATTFVRSKKKIQVRKSKPVKIQLEISPSEISEKTKHKFNKMAYANEPLSQVAQDSIGGLIYQTTKRLEEILCMSEQDIIAFRKKHGNESLLLLERINILISDRPKESLKKLLQSPLQPTS